MEKDDKRSQHSEKREADLHIFLRKLGGGALVALILAKNPINSYCIRKLGSDKFCGGALVALILAKNPIDSYCIKEKGISRKKETPLDLLYAGTPRITSGTNRVHLHK
jgi:hypothetical protein